MLMCGKKAKTKEKGKMSVPIENVAKEIATESKNILANEKAYRLFTTRAELFDASWTLHSDRCKRRHRARLTGYIFITRCRLNQAHGFTTSFWAPRSTLVQFDFCRKRENNRIIAKSYGAFAFGKMANVSNLVTSI